MLNAHMVSRKVTRRSMILAGLIVLAVGVLSGCSLIPAGWKTATGQAIEVTAFFPNTAGLYTTNDVAVLGMPVGQVTKIEEQGNRVMVKFTIDKNVPVPVDATAAIVNTSIVTTRHSELTPAYSKGPKLTDAAVMRNEGMSPVSVGDLFDAVDKLVSNLSGQAPGEGPVADLMDVTSGITSDNGQRLQEAINQLGSASQVVSGNGDAIVDIVKSVQQLTAALVANYPKMKDFSNSINQVSEMLGRQSPGLVATLGDLNQTLLNTSEFLHNNAGTIGASTGRLAALAENLSDYSRQVVETIDLGPLLFQNLSNSISAEQGAWRAQVLLDKSLLDTQLVSQFCKAINLHKNGCETGQLQGFGPDLGVFSALEALTK
ncbi:MCE family protein [Gordonia sp. i37]|uniref:MCE family protein n=1 Tax=Gordonia sp. i37 TaxID=1961707 RepID=UPI0009AEAB98|nr:MCE family protein [Gordonia sp. i37]OPX14832.1 virulence factor Mce [Gordonia sp. i37]